MVKWLVLLIVGLAPALGYGQFGVNIKYLIGGSETLDQVNISQDGVQASLEYGFRLKKKRLEFHPGIGYRTSFNSSDFDGYIYSIDFDFNTAIYPFDFGGDCNCPTFSKDGNIIKKGLFVEVSPGLSFQTLKRFDAWPFDPQNPQPSSDNNTLMKLSFGGGIDIGVSEAITITPLISYTLLSKADWSSLLSGYGIPTLDDQSYLGLGLRMTYKPNPKRLRRRR